MPEPTASDAIRAYARATAATAAVYALYEELRILHIQRKVGKRAVEVARKHHEAAKAAEKAAYNAMMNF